MRLLNYLLQLSALLLPSLAAPVAMPLPSLKPLPSPTGKDGWTSLSRTKQVSRSSDNIPITPLAADGILVTRHGEVRAASGSWKVLVTIDIPVAPTALRQEILEVTRAVVSAPVPEVTRQAWRRRLDQIEISLPTLVSSTPTPPILPGRVRQR